MKEVAFIKQNKKQWQSFEKNITHSAKSKPDELADQFLQLTDDLAYAKTFYPNSPTIAYLNTLAVKTHREVYKNKRESSNRFKHFWLTELPLELYHCRKYFIYSLIIFIIAAALGALSAYHDDGFARLITGDEYINTTLNNIEQGNPMGIYDSMGEFEMFIAITSNNIRVSFMVFVLGILTPLGVGYLLFKNGIMVGAFQMFFYTKGLFTVSSLAIYIHGALEIPGIIIAGGAGILLGNSFLFPNTLTRTVSLTRGVRRGIKIMVGLVPVFIVAGFLESFVTRHYNTLPLVINLFIIIASLGFIVWYFFIYPQIIYKNKNNA